MAFITQTMLGSLHLNPNDSPLSLSSVAPTWRASFVPSSQVSTLGSTTKVASVADIAVDFLNNVYSIGTAFYGTTQYGTITKQDSTGAVEWQRFISGTGTFTSVATDSSANVWVLVNWKSNVSTAIVRSSLLKFDSSGNLLATYDINPSGATLRSNGITIDPVTGTVHVYGVLFSLSTNLPFKTFIMKISSSGSLVDTYTYPLASIPSIQSLAIDANSNIYISSDATLVIKLSPAGVVIWKTSYSNSYAGPNDNAAAAVKLIIDTENNVYVMAGEVIVNSSTRNVFLYKLNDQGVLVWSRKFADTAASLSFDDENNILVHAISRFNNRISQTITSFSTDGKFQWKKHLYFSNRDLRFSKLVFSPDGAILIPGSVGGETSTPYFGLVVKIKLKASSATQFGEIADLNIINGPYAALTHTMKVFGLPAIVKDAPGSISQTFRVVPSSTASTLANDVNYAVTLA